MKSVCCCCWWAHPGYLALSADLKDKVTEATNRFFEARVAVMGFKCKVMQLEGQLHKEGGHANPVSNWWVWPCMFQPLPLSVGSL